MKADGKPLMPCHPARARELLRKGKAEVVRMVPFTIRLTYTIEHPGLQEVVGVDDGVKYAGVAVVSNGEVLLKGTLRIRDTVKRLMDLRRGPRRQRRERLRHRQPRYLNTHWEEGWLPPSVIDISAIRD